MDVSAERQRPFASLQHGGHVLEIRHDVAEDRAIAELDQRRRRAVVLIATDHVDGADERDVIERHYGHVRGDRFKIRPQPGELSAVDVPVVPEIGDVHRVETDEMQTAVAERVVVATLPAAATGMRQA